MTKHISTSIRIEEYYYKALKEQAKKEHRSINSEIQLAIISYVKQLEKKNEKTT